MLVGMPGLHIISGGCAVLAVDTIGRPTGNCTQPIAVRGRWRFDDETRSLLLCDEHLAELERDGRLSHVVRFYDATVEG